jgi:hypothetical protein
MIKEYNILGSNVKDFFNFFSQGKKGLFWGCFKGKMTK